MKRSFSRLLIILICIAFGWFIGYLRLPYTNSRLAFGVGFLSCIVLILFISAIRLVWRKNSGLIKWISEKQKTEKSFNPNRTYAFLWVMVSAFILLSALVVILAVRGQKQSFQAQLNRQSERISELTVITESLRKSNQFYLMNNVLNKVDDELKNNPSRKLTPETIARIAALCNGFKPYKTLEGDTISSRELSPERGQLLIALCLLKLDTSTFNAIKSKASFAKADLRGADLQNADLSKIDLNESDLSFANLKHSDLDHANLIRVQCIETRFDSANLSFVMMRNSTINNTYFNGAILANGNFKGCNFQNAQFIAANLNNTNFQWTKMQGSILRNATLIGADFIRSDLTRADLSEVNCSRGKLSMVIFKETNLVNIKLDTTEVQENWLEVLAEANASGGADIIKGYLVVKDTSSGSAADIFHLIRK